MQTVDIIYRKRNGGKLSPEEIRFVISEYTAGRVPDYQMSALLMAVFLRGMDTEETVALTQAMTESGEVMDLCRVPGAKVDKHSTGGVGDGTSLVIAPLLAACGAVVPMMSGRALGHTGGTLDKLESIPGFRVDMPAEQYLRQLADLGVAMIGQTERIAPADRKMYALRDVTATVESIPLIAASIMSKKIAEGCDALVLDVKTGSGAFMRRHEEARELARTMIAIGRGCGRKMCALLTDMNQPLGNAVGNALEVAQAVEVLRGGGPRDFVDVTLELGVRMLGISGVEPDRSAARERLAVCLGNGAALDMFRRIVERQGGDPRVVDDPAAVLPRAASRADIRAERSGCVAAFDTRAIGMAALYLGAGRLTKEDRVDHGAGIILHRKLGDRVEAGEPLATFHYTDAARLEEARAAFTAACRIEECAPATPPLIHEEIS